MLTITFKNVGHGDTIIIEWQNDKGENEIGIIDCRLADDESNLAIEHIEAHGYKKICFMILTNPNKNHFSGFPSLLEFCKKNEIQIKSFWHTVAYNKDFLEESLRKKITINDFFESFVNRKQDINNLKRLFREIYNLHKEPNSILNETRVINNTSMLPLNKKKKLFLKCFSPSTYDELMEYFRDTFKLDSEGNLEINKNNTKENNPKANLLSPIIKIYTDEWYALLTSNSTKYTFKRIMDKCKDDWNDRMIMAQIPHHGSKNNHFEPFWGNIPGKKDIPVFVSAGGSYGLPDKEVIEFFDDNYKEIHSTNFVGGLKEYFECKKYKNEDFDHINSLLDMCGVGFRECENPAVNCGEKQIKIEDNGTIAVFTNP